MKAIPFHCESMDRNQPTNNGATPLFVASQKGNVDLVKVLLKAGGNVNQARTTDGASPLYIASEKGNVDLVKVKKLDNEDQIRIKYGSNTYYTVHV